MPDARNSTRWVEQAGWPLAASLVAALAGCSQPANEALETTVSSPPRPLAVVIDGRFDEWLGTEVSSVSGPAGLTGIATQSDDDADATK